MSRISNLTYFRNSDFPLLLELDLYSGEKVTLAGEKDPEGTALSLDTILLEAEGPEQGSITLDDTGRPSSVTLVDGSVVKFEWQTDTRALVSLVTPDGEIQVNVSLDTASDPMQPVVAGLSSAMKPAKLRNFLDFPVYSNKLASSANELTALAGSTQGNILVNVTGAGEPISGATVRVNVGQTSPPK